MILAGDPSGESSAVVGIPTLNLAEIEFILAILMPSTA